MSDRVPFDIEPWLPLAVAWAQDQGEASLEAGRPLEPHEIELAHHVGVERADRVRLHVVEEFPRPEDAELSRVADQLGFLGPGMIGLTLGHAVLVDARHQRSERLLRHEFRHVHQYEVAGGFDAFLTAYLAQVVEYGYFDAPLEVDARAHELG